MERWFLHRLRSRPHESGALARSDTRSQLYWRQPPTAPQMRSGLTLRHGGVPLPRCQCHRAFPTASPDRSRLMIAHVGSRDAPAAKTQMPDNRACHPVSRRCPMRSKWALHRDRGIDPSTVCARSVSPGATAEIVPMTIPDCTLVLATVAEQAVSTRLAD